VKVAPLVAAAKAAGLVLPWVHTGSTGTRRSDDVLADLGLARPVASLAIGPGTASAQTARVLDRLPPVLAAERPDVLVVVGDVTSTLAATLCAVHAGVPVAHVEAGLRSFDETMPEERNRVLVDHVSARLYVTEPSGVRNLAREGIDRRRVRLVGNPMIDALRRASPEIERRAGPPTGEAVVTLHRPSNVDDPRKLAAWVRALADLAAHMPVRFAVHPRTRARLETGRLAARLERAGVVVTEPLAYVDFLARVRAARIVLTDSGGIQEEAAFLGVPCLTLRTTTERPLTVERGTNRLVGDDPARLGAAVAATLRRPPRAKPPKGLWDGHASDRIVADLRRFVQQR
jgi:UDP-N-acetylglucosamine 2-epimerase (non-hydrolysing)